MRKCLTCDIEIEDTPEAFEAHYKKHHPEVFEPKKEEPPEEPTNTSPKYRAPFQKLRERQARIFHDEYGHWSPENKCKYCNGERYVIVVIGRTQVAPGQYQVKSKKKPCIVCNENAI